MEAGRAKWIVKAVLTERRKIQKAAWHQKMYMRLFSLQRNQFSFAMLSPDNKFSKNLTAVAV